ncbi:redoxin domain-containing protein [Pontibacter toksunensis]|uniref:Redoxin domain-containing protein n=2 Tax=Pontibacter toksunensis TaxID=1332631 RepID=A0ABW6C023_9BACT
MLVSVLTTVHAKPITCTIKGTIINSDSKNILLHKATDDVRAKHVVIPIVNNTFEYTFAVSAPEVYRVVFEDEFEKGTWRRIDFFPEKGQILFTLYPMMEGGKNKIEGGELNKQLQDFWQGYDTHLEKEVTPYTEPLSKQLRALYHKGEYESPAADSIRMEMKKFTKKQSDWDNNYIDSNPNLASYYQFVSDFLTIPDYSKELATQRASVFSKLYPQHPYTELVRNKMESRERLQVGGKYFDFSAPTLEGKVVKLSKVMKDDYVLLDFWGSWCGSCIKISKSMIPVYEEFKDKGFTVIGIAREFKNTDKYKKAMERDKYPWLNLIELNDQNGIWQRYDYAGGGGTVLVNKKGVIVALDPTAEELRALLQKELVK